jgi:hypothetical protein
MQDGSSDGQGTDPVSARARAGWNVSKLKMDVQTHPERADQAMEDFDARCQRLTRLIERTAAVDDALARRAPPPIAPTKQDIDDVERFESAWAEWSRQHRPYGLVAEAAREAWANQGRAKDLSDLLRRFDRLDPAFAIDVHRLERSLAEPSMHADLHRALLDLEADQKKQRDAMQITVDRLVAEGLPVPPLSSATLLDGYDALEVWTRLSDDLQRMRLCVDRDVRPFDANVADRLIGRIGDVAEAGDRSLTADLDAELGRIVDGLQRRLDRLNATLDGWRKEGYTLPLEGRALPQDLLDWEANFDEVERLRARHGVAWRRLKEIARVRPDDAAQAMALAGHLEATEAFIDHVDALHAGWGQATALAQTMLEAWELEGFDTEAWHARVHQDPAAALRDLERHQGHVHRAIELRRRMDALDLSVEGEEGRTHHDELLRTVDLTPDLLNEVEAWTLRLERRTSRHRSLILEEWTDLRRRGWTDDVSPPPSMNLADAERHVDAMRKRAKTKRLDGGIEGRIRRRVLEEIETWAAQGWDVETLKERLDANPMDVGMAMPGLRQAVKDHRRLRRRLEALPWERNAALGADVLERMQRPEALLDLAHDLHDFARQLASSPPDPDALTWRSWRPTSGPTAPSVTVEVEPTPEPVEALETPRPAEHEPQRSEPVAIVAEANARPEAVEEEEEPEAPEERSPVVEDDAEDIMRDEKVPVRQRHSTSSITDGREDLRPTLKALITDLGLAAPEVLDAGSVRRTLGPHVQQQPKDIRVTRLLRLILRLLPEALDEATVGQKELVTKLAGMVDTLNAWTSLRLQARHLTNGHGLLEDALVLGEALHRIPGPGRRLPLGEDTHALPSPGSEEDLREEVLRLSQAVNLPSAGGIR